MSTTSSDHHAPGPVRPSIRSLLFTPATRPDWVEPALRSGADGIILDLEDAVPLAGKAAARATAAELVADWTHRTALFVRINRLMEIHAVEELRAIVHPGLSGILLPKVDCVADIVVADRLLSWCEHERGMPIGAVALVPLLETARGLREAYDIGRAATRIAYLGALAVPGGDIERALGYRWTKTGTETLALRSQVLLDARAAGVPNPISGLWTDIPDLDGLRRFAHQTRDLGYDGMMAIHPSHIPLINETFSLADTDAAHYRRILDALDTAERHGHGAVTVDGVMVDEAMATTARQRLGRHAGRQ